MVEQPQSPPQILPMDGPGAASTKRKVLGRSAAIAMILGSVYALEGGYVNDPHDRGGATNYGVTEKVARAAGYHGDMRYFPKHCTGPATVCADDIYVRNYIAGPGFMPIMDADPAVANELIDTAINMGPARPSKWFEQSLNELGSPPVPVTGRVDAVDTNAYRWLQTAHGAVQACVLMLDRLDAKQQVEYLRIVQRDPSQKKFLKGWLRARIGNVDRKNCGQGL